MTRNITEADISSIAQVATDSGLFTEGQLSLVREMVLAALSNKDSCAPFWLVWDDGRTKAVSYAEPERMTEGTWNIQLMAVSPAFQRLGLGRQLLAELEQALRSKGARMVLVETSGTDDFDYVRNFYASCGYIEEARIREFYAAGIDKITYRKVIM